MDKNTPSFPMPLRGLLLLAGMYSFAWSAFFRYFDTVLLQWLGMENTAFPQLDGSLYGTMGMFVSFLIFLTGFYPISWRHLILVGIAGKVILSTYFVLEYIPVLGWNKRTIFYLVFNELIVWVILGSIYLRAIKVNNYLAKLPEEDL